MDREVHDRHEGGTQFLGDVQQALQRRFDSLGAKSVRAGFALVGDSARSVDDVEPIGPSRVGRLDAVVEVIDDRGKLDSQVTNTHGGQLRPLLDAGWRGKDDFVPLVSEGSRGRADILTLQLNRASPATELLIELEETEEYGAAPPLVRDFQTIPASSLTVALGDLRQGVLTKDLPVGRHIDTITMQLINPDGPMDEQLSFVDNGEKVDGDYYYIRVKQLNGAWAWSSPIWVGGDPRL